jgi:DNA-binding CsgD family transcriptional regulator
MEKIISLVFIDRDKFFIEGMKQLILPYLKHKGMRVRVLDDAEAWQADIVFQAVERDWQARFCLRRALGGSQLNFALRASEDTRWRNQPRCCNESGVIFRNDPIESILMQVEHGLEESEVGLVAGHCYWCEQQRITRREWDVMRYLAWEMPPTAIANYLHLSVKTVSNHKQAAMRKLGFKRNADLYHWLRLDGLKTVKRYEK